MLTQIVPNSKIHWISWISEKQLPINEMSRMVAAEISKEIDKSKWIGSVKRVSFISHSLGGIIIRGAIEYLKEYKNLFGTYISLATPHLGYFHSTNKLLSLGLWVVQLTSLGLTAKIQLYNLIISFQKWAPCLKVNFNLFYFIEYMLDKWSWEKIAERSNCNCCFCSIDIKGKSKIFCCSFFVLLICFRIWTCWIVSGVKIVINEWLWKQVVATSKYMIHISNLISGRCIWVSFTTFFNKTIAT